MVDDGQETTDKDFAELAIFVEKALDKVVGCSEDDIPAFDVRTRQDEIVATRTEVVCLRRLVRIRVGMESKEGLAPGLKNPWG